MNARNYSDLEKKALDYYRNPPQHVEIETDSGSRYHYLRVERGYGDAEAKLEILGVPQCLLARDAMRGA